MAEPRRTFIVRVYGGDVVIEDVRSHRRARVHEVDAVGTQIGIWLAEPQMPAPAGVEDATRASQGDGGA